MKHKYCNNVKCISVGVVSSLVRGSLKTATKEELKIAMHLPLLLHCFIGRFYNRPPFTAPCHSDTLHCP